MREAAWTLRWRRRFTDVDSTALAEEPFVSISTFRRDGTPWAWPAYRALMVVTAAIQRLRRQAPSPWLTIRITPGKA